MRILASLDHSHIIKFVSGMFDNNEDDLYLFMEYASEGDLAMLIEQAKERKKRIAENLIWNIVLQVAEGTSSLS
ncbi:MAG: protein kinase [Planctomycetaceae bacterium]|nr:protein kinase [Planctomycetaceae bacterium]